MALSLGPEFPAPVNTTTVGNQVDSDSASAGAGLSVVVWTDYLGPSTSQIRAQRFQSGVPVGPEILVDGASPHDTEPAVALNRSGDFVVTWTRSSPGNTDVLARRFKWTGAPVGASFPVANTNRPESEPDVAIGVDGRFVVSYTVVEPNSTGAPATSRDILAKLYLNGNPAPVTIGVATTPRDESRSSVAMTPEGQFDVAYQDASGNNDVRLNGYSTTGVLKWADAVAASVAREEAPSVAMDNAGNAVVAYQELIGGHYQIAGRRVSGGGVMSPEMVVRKSLADHENPSVALSPSGGPFVVAYDTATPGLNRVEVTEVANVPGAPLSAGAERATPAVSIDALNNYMLTYTSNDRGDLNIRGRRGHL